MAVRELFAENLKRFVEEKGSASFVCRQLRINRQQFERYLKAESLPNDETLTHMSRYFGVSEMEFFLPQQTATPGPRLSLECLEVIRRVVGKPPNLSSGAYVTYFWVPALPNEVVGAVTFVRRDIDVLSFRRLTTLRERKDPVFSYIRGDHQGAISERLGWLYFQGSNRKEPCEPSLLTVRWLTLSNPMLAGHGTVLTPIGPAVANVAMVPLQPAKLWRLLRHARVYDVNDKHLTLVMRVLREAPTFH